VIKQRSFIWLYFLPRPRPGRLSERFHLALRESWSATEPRHPCVRYCGGTRTRPEALGCLRRRPEHRQQRGRASPLCGGPRRAGDAEPGLGQNQSSEAGHAALLCDRVASGPTALRHWQQRSFLRLLSAVPVRGWRRAQRRPGWPSRYGDGPTASSARIPASFTAAGLFALSAI
jgi:hypothetical protein